MGSFREDVEYFANFVCIGVNEVEAASIQLGLVGYMINSIGDIVHRHDVHLAALNADNRAPLGDAITQLLNEFEEIIGAVDLIHLSGLGVAHNHCRAVDAIGNFAFLAY